jgi:predicted ABC-type ATPase
MGDYVWRIDVKYNPAQPRVPAGDPQGGQWTSSGNAQAKRKLTDYLRQVAGMSANTKEAIVLKHGQHYEPQPLPEGYERGKSKQCYANATRLSQRTGLTYVEGYAVPDFIDLPIAHAWCVDDDGRVVDNTWKTPGRVYYGVPMDQRFMASVMMETGTFGVLDFRSEAFRERYAADISIPGAEKGESVGDYVWRLDVKYDPDQPRIPAGQPGGGRWASSGGVGGFRGEPANPDGKDTLEQYRNADGSWTPERQALHDRIKSTFFEGKTPVDNPQAWIMGGGPAAGKSSLLRKGLEKIPENHVLANSDEVKVLLPEYKTKGRQGAAFVHEESSYLAKQIAQEAADRGYNVLLDGTGDSRIEKLAKKVQMMGGKGKVHGIYVTVDPDEAVRRSMKRAERTGRWVPESVIRGSHAGVSRVFPTAEHLDLFKSLRLYDNNGSSPRLIAEEVGGKLNVLDQAAYDDFLSKGG